MGKLKGILQENIVNLCALIMKYPEHDFGALL